MPVRLRPCAIALALWIVVGPVAARAQQNAGATTGPAADAGSQLPAAEPQKKPEPFAFADFTWLTGNPRTTESPLESKALTGEVRVDTNFTYSFNKPQDDSIGGSSEIFRSGEFQLTQFGVGGDFHYDNVQASLMTQFGMYSQTTPRNDPSPARGQWGLDGAYRYVSEAYGGYHFDRMSGVNVQAGIFMSYVGLWSYYQFDNWTYRHANVPYFSGEGGMTPPGGNARPAGSFVPGWSQDLRRSENRVTFALLVKL